MDELTQGPTREGKPTADTVLEARDFRARAQTLMGKELGEYRPLVGAAMGDHRGTRVDA